jgi:DNA-binding NarL/FixJ family response regulator
VGQADGRTLRVLLVEDDEDLRTLVHIKLDLDDRFTVVGESTNGAHGVGDAKALQPDVVLLDLMMPVLDGEAALPLIRLASPDTAVVTFSALAVDNPRIARLSGDAHLCKTDVNEVGDTLSRAWWARDRQPAV